MTVAWLLSIVLIFVMPRTAAFTIVGGAQIMLPTPHREEWSSSVLLRVTALSSEVVWLRLKQNETSSSKDFKHTRPLMRLSNSIFVGYLSPVIFGALLPVLSHRRLHDRARREDLIKLRRMLGTDPTVTTILRKIAELHFKFANPHSRTSIRRSHCFRRLSRCVS